MKTKNKNQRKEQNVKPQQPPAAPVIKVKTNIKAGYYLSFTIGAGAEPTSTTAAA
jgi:hypothetical protein